MLSNEYQRYTLPYRFTAVSTALRFTVTTPKKPKTPPLKAHFAEASPLQITPAVRRKYICVCFLHGNKSAGSLLYRQKTISWELGIDHQSVVYVEI